MEKAPMTKAEYIWSMIDRVAGAKNADDGDPSFMAENVDILEIMYPRTMCMELDDGMAVTIDLKEEMVNAATKDQLSVLLSSISPSRVHVCSDDVDGEIDDDGTIINEEE